VSFACRMLGHRPRFWAEDETLHWRCERECGAEGEKRYASAAEARRYAAVLDREDSDELGRRAPLSLLPLRFARRRSRS
jgi:hypothetical protein